jgi:hypothetical protein
MSHIRIPLLISANYLVFPATGQGIFAGLHLRANSPALAPQWKSATAYSDK